MITIRDVARQAGVSVATVSRVLNNSALVSPETRELVLQAVSQLDTSAMQQFEGAGLSLHLSQKLAALLHGEILFDSAYGVGSVLTLALPLET